MTTVQQILYTGHPAEWHTLARALGLVAPYDPTPEWGEFEGDGVLAIHHAMPDHPAGTVDLHLLVEELDTAAEALVPFEPPREHMEGVGDLLRITTTEGFSLTVSEGARTPRGDVAVQPIWFAAELAEPRRILEALGLRPGVVGDGGGWAELSAPGGGMVALHGLSSAETADAPGIGLSFLAAGDLDALAERVRAAGFGAAVIDEAFGRTIRIPSPDGGHEIWINGTQDDLYGFHREG